MGFVKRRLLRLVLLMIVLPVLGAVALRLSEEIEARRGATRLSSALRRTGFALRRTPPPRYR